MVCFEQKLLFLYKVKIRQQLELGHVHHCLELIHEESVSTQRYLTASMCTMVLVVFLL